MSKTINLLHVTSGLNETEKEKVILGTLHIKKTDTVKGLKAAYDEIIGVCTKHEIPPTKSTFLVSENDLSVTATVIVPEMSANPQSFANHTTMQIEVGLIKSRYGLPKS